MYDLENIVSPEFLKTMSNAELEALCNEIRAFLINSVSKTGGHLGPNLGVVELTVALHKVFNSPEDKFIFDVGHQAYTHKILTGRASKFSTLRQYKGLSGFLKSSESEHDVWEAGHSSTSISAAAGFVYARDYLQENYHVIALIGDGSLTSGMAYEALNHLGQANKRVIVILNDNKMSISENVGGVTKILNRMRLSRKYNKAKNVYLRMINKEKHIFKFAKRVRDSLKTFLMNNNNIFEEMGFEYFGPIDGHDLNTLIKTFSKVKDINKPLLIHVLTKKGKGYKYAEDDTIGTWHGIGPFNVETGKTSSKSKDNEKSWSIIISEALTKLAQNDEKIVAITPAMKQGSGLQVFENVFPNRLIDVGIAEEHAITFAGGLAISGMKPFCTIYSTFLQRAYDQINHDLARQNLGVVVGIDRAGLVEGDGDTHQGIFDIAFLRHIPNVNIMMPKDAFEAYDLLYTAFSSNKLCFIRYPRGNTNTIGLDDYQFSLIEFGSWTIESVGSDLIFITYGPQVKYLLDINEHHNLNATVVNARFIKPLDDKLLLDLFNLKIPIIVFEEAIQTSGLNSAILEYAQKINQNTNNIYSIAINETFVDQGDKTSIYQDLKIDEVSILNLVKTIKDKK